MPVFRRPAGIITNNSPKQDDAGRNHKFSAASFYLFFWIQQINHQNYLWGVIIKHFTHTIPNQKGIFRDYEIIAVGLLLEYKKWEKVARIYYEGKIITKHGSEVELHKKLLSDR